MGEPHLKFCTRCGEDKHPSKFPRQTRPRQKQYWCKLCRKAYDRQRRMFKPPG